MIQSSGSLYSDGRKYQDDGKVHVSKRRYVSKMLKLGKHELGKRCLRAKERTLYQLDNKDHTHGYFFLYYCLFKHALPHSLIHPLPLKLCSLADLDSLPGCIFFHFVFFIISLLKSPVNFPRPGGLSCLALCFPQQTGLTTGGPQVTIG